MSHQAYLLVLYVNGSEFLRQEWRGLHGNDVAFNSGSAAGAAIASRKAFVLSSAYSPPTPITPMTKGIFGAPIRQKAYPPVVSLAPQWSEFRVLLNPFKTISKINKTF